MALNQKYVNFQNFDVRKIRNKPSEQRKINSSKSNTPISYYFIPLFYMYGNDNTSIGDFLLETCEMETNYGITETSSESNTSEYLKPSIFCKFNLNNPEHTSFLEKMNSIYDTCVEMLYNERKNVKLFNFSKENAEFLFKNPIYYPKDDEGNLIKGRSPSIYLKLLKRKTSFVDLNNYTVPWIYLKDVEMKFIPLIHIRGVFIQSTRVTIQMEVLSAVITSIVSKSKNSVTLQKATIQKIKETKPELVNLVSSQIAQISSERQNQKEIKSLEYNINNEDAEITDDEIIEPSLTKINEDKDTLKEFVASAPVKSNGPILNIKK